MSHYIEKSLLHSNEKVIRRVLSISLRWILIDFRADYDLAWIIHTTCYCKQQWLAPESNARSFFLNVGFTTSCVGVAQAHADAQTLPIFALAVM